DALVGDQRLFQLCLLLFREALLAGRLLENSLTCKRSPHKVHDPACPLVRKAPPCTALVSPGVPQGSRQAAALRLFEQLLRVMASPIVQPPVHLRFTSRDPAL
ncbi:MAG TPA: hypothetical protein VGP74_03050, partial [Rubrobacteraceae bacterium]|nr:hypothetical protein [Rubrobacteraceae bacterium]